MGAFINWNHVLEMVLKIMRSGCFTENVHRKNVIRNALAFSLCVPPKAGHIPACPCSWCIMRAKSNFLNTRWLSHSCKRASFWSLNPTRARSNKPKPDPSPTFIFEARFRPESQIHRVSQDMRNCGVSKNVVYGYSCRYTVLSHPKQQPPWPKH